MVSRDKKELVQSRPTRQTLDRLLTFRHHSEGKPELRTTMDYQLPEELRMLKETLQRFIDNEVILKREL